MRNNHIFQLPTPKTSSRNSTQNQEVKTTKRYIAPAIKLLRPTKKELRKDEALEFELRTNPTADKSPSYKLTVPYFADGTPEELILFIKAVRKVIHGQHATAGAAKYALIRRILQGDALAAFNRAAEAAGNESNENFELALRGLQEHVFPRKALMNQKRFMRHFLRKPFSMTIREFINRLVEINEYLTYFPPFNQENKLPVEELMDIAEFAVPSQWQKAMVLHGFDPTEHTPSEFVEFGERLEYAEAGTTNQPKAEGKNDAKHGNNEISRESRTRFQNKKRKFQDREKFCEYHNTTGHDTGECKVMIAQAKRMRATWEAKKPGHNTQQTYSNKTWNRTSKIPEKPKTNLQREINLAIQAVKQRRIKEENQHWKQVEKEMENNPEAREQIRRQLDGMEDSDTEEEMKEFSEIKIEDDSSIASIEKDE